MELDPFLPVLRNEPPEELRTFLSLVENPTLTTSEIDEEMARQYPMMGIKPGFTREKLKKYPALARSANQSRITAFRNVGLDSPRNSAYQAYADTLKATREIYSDGVHVGTEPDHRVRIDAAQKILKVLGDETLPSPAQITVQNNDNKIIIIRAAKEEAHNVIDSMEDGSNAKEIPG